MVFKTRGTDCKIQVLYRKWTIAPAKCEEDEKIGNGGELESLVAIPFYLTIIVCFETENAPK